MAGINTRTKGRRRKEITISGVSWLLRDINVAAARRGNSTLVFPLSTRHILSFQPLFRSSFEPSRTPISFLIICIPFFGANNICSFVAVISLCDVSDIFFPV